MLKINEDINNISGSLNTILENHTEMTMKALRYFACQEKIKLKKENSLIIDSFSCSRCDSRYIIHSLKQSKTHSLENKNEKILKLEHFHEEFHKVIKHLFEEYFKENVISIQSFDQFSLIKQNFFSFLTELIIEAEGFEKRFDGLTTFYNKKYFLQEVKLRGDRTDYTIVMADIDFFKKINDTYGHQAGDFILVELAELYKKELRKNDLLGRYGGEEFIFLLKGSVNQTQQVIERVRTVIENKVFKYEGHDLKITSSFGLCDNSNATYSLPILIKKADLSLYKSKNNGRNQLTVHSN